MIHEPLMTLQRPPSGDGGACGIVASERSVDDHDLRDRAVEISGLGGAVVVTVYEQARS